MNHKFTTVELTTDGTITQLLNRKGAGTNGYTKLTMQVIPGAVVPLAGTITISAKVDVQNAASVFQTIGTFDLAAQVPVFIQGSYEELQFVGTTMTATSSAFIAIAATR